MTVNRDRARDLYGAPALEPLWAAARERLERRGSDARGRLTLRGLDAEQRRAVARLLGARLEPEGDVWVRLEDLDVALQRQALAAPLPDILEALGGPLERRYSRAAVRAETRAIVFGDVAKHPAMVRHPALAVWVDGLRARGRLAHLPPDAGRALLRAALGVADRLPADGVPLPVLAGSTVGDTHALDRGSPLAVLVESALPLITGTDAPDRRSLWAAAGVALEGVSSSALVLNLRVEHERLGPLFAAAASAGEPLHVTLRMLRDTDVLRADAGLVSVCENRSVMEATADRLGSGSAPLVCLSGEPTTAGRRLIAALAASGTRLRYHGDFDPDGVAIANRIIGRAVDPWRFGTDDYLAAVASTRALDGLRGSAVDASWDPQLGSAMTAAGAVVYEEQVLDALIADLAQSDRPEGRRAAVITPGHRPEPG